MIRLQYDCPHSEQEHRYPERYILEAWPQVYRLVADARKSVTPEDIKLFEASITLMLHQLIAQVFEGIKLEPIIPEPGMWLAIDIEGEDRDEWSISVAIKEYWEDGDHLCARIMAAVVAVAPGAAYQLTPPREIEAEAQKKWAKVFLLAETAPPPQAITVMMPTESAALRALTARLKLGKWPSPGVATIREPYSRLGAAAAFLEQGASGAAMAYVLPSKEYHATQLITRILLASIGQVTKTVHADGTVRRFNGLPWPDDNGIVVPDHDIVILSGALYELMQDISLVHN